MSVEVVGHGGFDSPEAALVPELSQTRQTRDGQRLRDCLMLLALLLGICAIFAKTVFLGVPISKLARLTLWDSAFASYRQGPGGLMDPSLVQLMIPYYCMVAKLWHAGQVPLWNPYNGCGVPLLADPQSCVFSPLHAVLALIPSLRVYNLVLVFQVWLAAAGSFLLGRSLGLNRTASTLAATAFAFCPFVDWNMELNGSGYILFPLLFWLFARAAEKPSRSRAALAGVGTAAVILSGHPEVSFCGIVSASCLMLALIVCGAYQQKSTPLIARIKDGFVQLTIAAAVAFCLSAPLLLPFCEYLMHSACYKFTSGAPQGIPFLIFLINLLQPALGGASMYLGFLPLLCLPFCIATKNEQRRNAVIALLTVALATEAFTSQLWPVSWIVQLTPLKSLIPNYCQTVPLLLLAVLAGFGMQHLMETNAWANNRRGVVTLIGVAILVVVAPLLLQKSKLSLAFLSFDSALAEPHLSSNEWLLLALLTGAGLALLLSRSLWKQPSALVPVLLCIALSFFGQFNQAKHALPAQSNFDYPMVPAVEALSDCPSRYIAIGDHLLKPNTNVVYGLCEFRVHNPMFPLEFRELIQCTGAQLDGFNQLFNPPLNPRLGLASVSRILSLQPIWSTNASAQLKMQAPATPCQWSGLQLRSIAYAYDPSNKQIIGRLACQSSGNETAKRNWSYSIVIEDNAHVVQWFSDSEPIPAAPFFEREFALPVSSNRGGALTANLQVFDHQKSQLVRPLASGQPSSNRHCKLFEFMPGNISTNLPVIRDDIFSLLKEVPPNLRVYENRAALPSAYLVQHVETAQTPEQALAILNSATFDAKRTAVVESANTPESLRQSSPAHAELIAAQSSPAHAELIAAAQSSSAHGGLIAAPIERPSDTEVSVQTHGDAPGLLVLTDTYYPGWKAEVDGKPADIVRTNVLFRGVFLPAGHHHVRFIYRPLWFYIGITLALTCSAVLVAWKLISLRNESTATGRNAS